MARKDFRHFIATHFMSTNATLDEDKAYVMADELWGDACKGNKKAILKLGELVNMYKKRELT